MSINHHPIHDPHPPQLDTINQDIHQHHPIRSHSPTLTQPSSTSPSTTLTSSSPNQSNLTQSPASTTTTTTTTTTTPSTSQVSNPRVHSILKHSLNHQIHPQPHSHERHHSIQSSTSNSTQHHHHHPSTSIDLHQPPRSDSSPAQRLNHHPSLPTSTPPLPSDYQSITPQELIRSLKSNFDSNLILDIRSISSFKRSHLKRSVTLNLPTTLLKRPLYGADRIQSSLASSEERERFGRYKTALPGSTVPIDSNLRLNQIIVLDHDTRLINPNHPLTLVLKKFTIVGFTGRLVWLYSGFQGLLAWIDQQPSESFEYLLELDHQNSHPTELLIDPQSCRINDLRMSLSIPPPNLNASLPTPPTPSTHHPTLDRQSPFGLLNRDSRLPERSQRLSHHPKRLHMSLSVLAPFSPFVESPPSISNLSSSASKASFTRRSPNLAHSNPSNLKLPPQSCTQPTFHRSPVPNPFFDNIRQLNERLSLAASLQNISPIELPILSNPTRDLTRLPAFLRRLLQDSPEHRAQRLAHEFHDLELAEQLRLQDVMRWESSRGALILQPDSSSIPVSSSSNSVILSSQPTSKVDPTNYQLHSSSYRTTNHHPFSISAGVELGYKNRYKNIWPYEHTRIRLREGPTRRNGTDYVNASMISFRSDGAPEGLESFQVGRRRYIATQGPLTSTFEDFWSVVGEEDVGLIIMITRRHEAGREKCADYVRSGQYGEIVISVDPLEAGNNGGMESDGDDDRDQRGGFFGFASNNDNTHDVRSVKSKSSVGRSNTGGLLRKTVNLSRADRPDLPARKIAHIQYRGWPDFDVPPAVEEVLRLIDECHGASEEIIRLNDEAIEEHSRSSSSSLSSSSPCSAASSPTLTRRVQESSEDIRKVVGRGSGPIIVHCSAGVGRTGSFILLDVMIEVLKAKSRLLSRRNSAANISDDHQPAQESNPNPKFDLPSYPSSDRCTLKVENWNKDAPNSSDTIHSDTSQMSIDDPKPIKSLNAPPYPTLPSTPSSDSSPSASKQHINDKNSFIDHQGPQRFKSDQLPKFLASQLCDCRTEIAPIWQEFPIMAVVNEMREQRMSMVANYRQYVFLHEVLLHFIIQELQIPTMTATTMFNPTINNSNACNTTTATNNSSSNLKVTRAESTMLNPMLTKGEKIEKGESKDDHGPTKNVLEYGHQQLDRQEGTIDLASPRRTKLEDSKVENRDRIDEALNQSKSNFPIDPSHLAIGQVKSQTIATAMMIDRTDENKKKLDDEDQSPIRFDHEASEIQSSYERCHTHPHSPLPSHPHPRQSYTTVNLYRPQELESSPSIRNSNNDTHNCILLTSPPHLASFRDNHDHDLDRSIDQESLNNQDRFNLLNIDNNQCQNQSINNDKNES